jgi:hypothetical protein
MDPALASVGAAVDAPDAQTLASGDPASASLSVSQK